MDISDTVVERGHCGHLQLRKTCTASQGQTALDNIRPYHPEYTQFRQTALDRLHPGAQNT